MSNTLGRPQTQTPWGGNRPTGSSQPIALLVCRLILSSVTQGPVRMATKSVVAFAGAFQLKPTCAAAQPELAPRGFNQLRRFRNGWVATRGERPMTLLLKPAAETLVIIRGRPFALDDQPPSLSSRSLAYALTRMDGRFGMVVMSESHLALGTDLLGASAVFYHYDISGILYFSSHLGLLIDCLPRTPGVDRLGAAAILAGSCQVAERTHFQGVHRLPAASVLIADTTDHVGPPQCNQYVSPEQVLCSPRAVHHTNPQRIQELLAESIAREHITESDGLLLSGGLDSRAIAYALRAAGVPRTVAFTYGEDRSLDLRGARHVAHELGYRHERLAYGNWRFSEFAPFIAVISGGMSGLQTSQNLAGIQQLPQNCQAVLVGFLGGVLSGSLLNVTDPADALLPFAKSYGVALEQHYGPELRQLREEIIETEYADDTVTKEQARIIQNLKIRQATWISATLDLWDWQTPVKTPFFHRKLMQHFLCLPAAELYNQAHYRRWMAGAQRRQRSQGRRRPIGLRYQLIKHAVLDRLHWRTGLTPPVDLVDWQRRVKAEALLFHDIANACPEPDLAAVIRGELDREGFGPPLLIAAGHALAISDLEL